MTKAAILALADGTVFEGQSIGAPGEVVGELVFNTAMTGYQEILTDPSYAKQIVTLTTSHVGNTGCNQEDMESSRAWAEGLVVRHCSHLPSNYRAQFSLPEWLKKKGVVAISGIDTRALTNLLREKGAVAGCISTQTQNPDLLILKAKQFQGIDGIDLANEVSRKTIERWDGGLGDWALDSEPLKYHVVVYDYGVKTSILNILHDKGCHLTIVPAKTPLKDVLDLNPDGIVLSNGPGDPAVLDYAIETARQILHRNIPLLGICLGFQILALAVGAKTQKMKFGHHGANHPVMELKKTNRIYITSQNHSYMVDEATLPADMVVSHRSLFDQSIQGIEMPHLSALGFQGHPEASPGPHDICGIFDCFITFIAQYQKIVQERSIVCE